MKTRLRVELMYASTAAMSLSSFQLLFIEKTTDTRHSSFERLVGDELCLVRVHSHQRARRTFGRETRDADSHGDEAIDIFPCDNCAQSAQHSCRPSLPVSEMRAAHPNIVASLQRLVDPTIIVCHCSSLHFRMPHPSAPPAASRTRQVPPKPQSYASTVKHMAAAELEHDGCSGVSAGLDVAEAHRTLCWRQS